MTRAETPPAAPPRARCACREAMAIAAALLAALAAAGCGTSPPANFYTLAQPATAAASGASASGGSAPATPRWVIAIGPVSVPGLVDRPQLVLRTGGQRVEV